MTHKIDLKRIIELLGHQLPDQITFWNIASGEFATIGEDTLRTVDQSGSLEDLPRWKQEEIELARRILDEGSQSPFIPLPTQSDVHELMIMDDFCHSLTNEKLREDLFNSFKGQDAFQRFEFYVRYFNVMDEWYAFRDQALKDLAIEWCGANGLEYE